MQLFLQASGYHLTIAQSVEAALQAAAQEEFDLLLSNIDEMP
jgi:CheY-like chemotaxis protein